MARVQNLPPLTEKTAVRPARVDDQCVAEYTRHGLSASQIATILRVTERSVRRSRRRLGIAQNPAALLSADERARAAALLQDGCSYSDVAATLGRTPRTISRNFPGYGWTRGHARVMRCAIDAVEALPVPTP